MALIDEEVVNKMKDEMLEILKQENKKIKEKQKNCCLDKIPKPQNLEIMVEALMSSPYLDVLYGDRENYEMAAEHLISEDIVKVVRCKNCRWFIKRKYEEGYDGNCDLRGGEVRNDYYCNHGERTPRNDEVRE